MNLPLDLFQRRHQQPPPLGRVLLAEKLVRQLLRLHGAPGAPWTGRGRRRPGREPREGELAARNRAAAPPDGPAPSGSRAAGLALERVLGGEARGRPPTRHGHQPQRANAARRRWRRHPAPPPRGRAPPLPGPPARRRRPGLPSAAAAARPPARRGCAPGPGLAPRRSRRLGKGVWRDAPAAASAQRSRDLETRATPGGAELGPGSSGGGDKARGRCWGIWLP